MRETFLCDYFKELEDLLALQQPLLISCRPLARLLGL